MDDNSGRIIPTEYSEIQVSGQASVHAGSSAVYISIQNINVGQSSDNFNLQRLFGSNPNLAPPQFQSPPFGANNLTDTYAGNNVAASPSQSSESTNNPEYSYGRIIQMPSPSDPRYTYFLNGDGLARHVVERYAPQIAGPRAEVCRFRYQGREGFLVVGKLLDDDQVAGLRQRSRDYDRQRRIDRHTVSRD